MNSRKTVELSRGLSAKTLSKNIIKAFLGLFSTLEIVNSTRRLFIMFVLKKSIEIEVLDPEIFGVAL